jgi:4-hydroxyphenylacetate 3-monooxygenase
MSGNDKIPAVQEVLGKLAAYEAAIGAMVHGTIHGVETDWPGGEAGFVCYNRRFMYGALNWCQENHTGVIDTIRELAGGNPLLMPADSSALEDPALGRVFKENFHVPQADAYDRLKLMKIVWDLTGSEFAGRNQLYEKFYAGSSFVVRNQSFREAPWEDFKGKVLQVMEKLATPEPLTDAAE